MDVSFRLPYSLSENVAVRRKITLTVGVNNSSDRHGEHKEGHIHGLLLSGQVMQI